MQVLSELGGAAGRDDALLAAPLGRVPGHPF